MNSEEKDPLLSFGIPIDKFIKASLNEQAAKEAITVGTKRKGMCRQCLEAVKRKQPYTGAKSVLYCRKYAAFCQRVAHNCPGPEKGD
jgi:late competence protein required for DNA uptake (superfamily II DNA/RNA helicase)